MATDKYINIKVNSKGAETNIKRLDNEMTNLGREVDKTNDSFSKLSRVAAAVGTALTLFNIDEKIAVGFGSVMWAAQTAMIIVFGGLAFLLLPIYNKNKEAVNSTLSE